MRTVIYARYSSSTQTEQSIEGQIRVCTEYAKGKNMQIVGTYIDRAISGRTDNRPEFQRMIADSGKKIFDAIIVYKTDRFARNKYDSAIYKSQLKKNGVQIFYAAESIPEGPEGIILESLMEGLAEYYSLELSQKIRRGIRESVMKNKFIGGGLALGYKIGPDKSFQIDEDAALVVKMIFDMYNRGIPSATICKELNDQGIKTLRGNPFNKSSIGRIIKNKKYIGQYDVGDIHNKDGIPAIISKEVFHVAQRELEKRRTSKQAQAPRAEYLLSGKLYCGHCKKAMIGISGTSKTSRKYYYYYCPVAKAKSGCNKKQIPRDWLENLIVAETVNYVFQPGVIKEIAHKVFLRQEKENDTAHELAYFEKKLAENKKAIANILKTIEAGEFAKSLSGRLNTLETEQTAIEGEIAYLKATKFALTEEQIGQMSIGKCKIFKINLCEN